MNVTLCSGKFARLLMVVATVAGLAVSAKAETLLVDFGNNVSFRGVSVPAPDLNGHYWNSLQPGPFYPNLVDIGNVSTSIGLGYTTGVGTDSYNGPAGPTSIPPTAAEIAATDIDAAALGDLGVKEAAFDFAASPGGLDNNTRFEISGLNPAEKYTLTLYGAHEFSDDDSTAYSIYSDATYSTQVAAASLLIQTPGSPWLHNRDNVATLSNLSAAGGSLFVQFVGANGNLGYLNSFKLVGAAVPEPTSFLLLSSGLALVFGYRRR